MTGYCQWLLIRLLQSLMTTVADQSTQSDFSTFSSPQLYFRYKNFLSNNPQSFLMLSFLRIYILTCLLPDLSIYSSQNRPIPFPGRRSLEATKPGFRFLGVHFMLQYILLLMHVCFCCICFSFSVLSQDIGWEGRLQSPKWPILCRVGRKTFTQSTLIP